MTMYGAPDVSSRPLMISKVYLMCTKTHPSMIEIPEFIFVLVFYDNMTIWTKQNNHGNSRVICYSK